VCISEFDDTTRKQEASASLVVEVFISVWVIEGTDVAAAGFVSDLITL